MLLELEDEEAPANGDEDDAGAGSVLADRECGMVDPFDDCASLALCGDDAEGGCSSGAGAAAAAAAPPGANRALGE